LTKKSKRKEKKKPSATKTVRMPDGHPLFANVILALEDSDMRIIRVQHSGYVSQNAIIYDDGIVLSKEIDGWPFIEIPNDRTIEMITYEDPAQQALKEKFKVVPIIAVNPVGPPTPSGSAA